MKDVNDVFIAGQPQDTSNTKLSSSEADQRLQQAVHILANGAIRAAMKQRSEKHPYASKPTPTTNSPMSEIQTLAEIGCKSMQEFPTKKTCKKSHLGRTAEGLIAQVQ